MNGPVNGRNPLCLLQWGCCSRARYQCNNTQMDKWAEWLMANQLVCMVGDSAEALPLGCSRWYDMERVLQSFGQATSSL